MSKNKLFVMHTKLVKFFKSLKDSPKIYILGFRDRGKPHKNLTVLKSNFCRDFLLPICYRSRTPVCKKACLILRRRNQINDKMCFSGEKQALENGVFNLMLRSLTVSTLDGKSPVWRCHTPQESKDQRRENNSAPSCSRGVKRKSESWVEESSLKTTKLYEDKLKEKEQFENVFKRLAEQYNGTIEQGLYTSLRRKDKIVKLGGDDWKREEFTEIEMPPVQKCRLCCPLPPPEFIPMEKTKFLPNFQPPSVRFSSQPAIFLPANSITKEGSKSHILKLADKSVSQYLGTVTSNKKIYPINTSKSDKKHVKKQNQEPWQETPKMKALIFEPDSLDLSYFAVDAPNKIHKDEVLVQVVYSGVCGTDLFITEGKVSCGEGPLILGHEISGKVYALGSDVNHVKTGDNVVINPYTACCVCRYCTNGLLSSCLNEGLNNFIGVHKNGGWAEFVVVKKGQVFKVPKELNLDQAALIQPLSCVLNALSKLNLSIGLDVMVQGLGLAGCLWASVLHAKGHKNVIVSDKSEQKRQQFSSLKLGYPFLPQEEMGQRSMDVIIECTGSSLSIEKCLKMMRPNGQICLFGKPHPTTEIRCVPYDIVRKEITVIGNAGNAFCFSKALDLATSMGYRYIDFDKLGVKVFNLQDFREAFQMKKSGNVGKIMFKFEG